MLAIFYSLVVALMVGSSQTANAVPITFNFTGTATSQSGKYLGPGSAVTGFYTFDTSLTYFNAANPGRERL